MSQAAAQSYIDKWLAAHPAQRLGLVFIDPVRRQSGAALAALQHELAQAAGAIREAQVAAAKLNWWAEELAGAPASGGRHPLTRALFEAPAVVNVSAAQWLAPIQAALAQLAMGTAADFAAQLAAGEALHGALAALETAWWFGPQATLQRAARMATLGRLLDAAARLHEQLTADRLPLPMARLARHGLDRDALGQDSPALRAALREQLRDIAAGYAQAWALPGPLCTLRGLDARLGQAWSRRASQAARPLPALHALQSRQTGPVTLWRAWQAARAARPGRA